MDSSYATPLMFSLFLSAFTLLCFNLLWTRRRRKVSNATPGPTPLPLIGNLLQLGIKPHESLAELAKTYGPLMTMKLGRVNTVIVSSPGVARQVLQTQDHVLAYRTIPDAIRALNHHEDSMGWLPPNQQWRSLRKLCNSHVFSAQHLNANTGVREKKVNDHLKFVHEKAMMKEMIDVGQVAFATILNLISNMLFSVDLIDVRSETVQEFKRVVRGVMDEVGKPNIADYFPVFRLVDPQRIRRRTSMHLEKLNEIFEELIERRLQSRDHQLQSSNSSNDLLDALLNNCQKDGSKLSKNTILTLLQDVFIAGSDTSSSTIEWAMAELLRNPEKLEKVKAELRDKIKEGKQIEESDIPYLLYLQAVVKETLRLHPPAPLLLPRRAQTDVELCGFNVPKNTQVLVNVWAIGRDGRVWKNPNCFEPERFLESEIGFKGRDFELLPFGAGRRICPGLPLADRMVPLFLGALLHRFDWEIEDGMKAEALNMEEKFGLTLQKALPLTALPVSVS
ncbi:hypothetical protein Scep_016152 [Stephania cephalantha]|uniref:Geraniol 8-hydroxylase-like n=1 Tax=Stephania cephalantha TaxID=152367 RepID=A0AAP0NTX6_9MAGN